MKAFLSTQYFPWLSKYYDLAMYTLHASPHGNGDCWGVRLAADCTPCPKSDACLDWAHANNGKA
jgi:hypothetical protein